MQRRVSGTPSGVFYGFENSVDGFGLLVVQLG
jgi:hypothetical protein